SLAVSLARRSSADGPVGEAVASAGQVGAVNADDERETAGMVAGDGRWSCAGMRNGAFRQARRGGGGGWGQAEAIGSQGTGCLEVGRGAGPVGVWSAGLGGDRRRVRDVNIASLAHSSASLLIPFWWVVGRG